MPLEASPKQAIGDTLQIGLISNPRSHRNRKAMPEIRKFLQSQNNVTQYEASTPDEINACLQKLLIKNIDVVAINGGDGTIQAALTSLLSDSMDSQIPLLAIIPGGNTNMTARDLGLKGGVIPSLRRLCAWAESNKPAETVSRPVIRVQANTSTAPLFGMFFGIGAITKGIEYCHHKIYKLGLNEEIGPGLATLRILLAIARRDPQFTSPTLVELRINGEPNTERQNYLMLLVSTLEHLFLGIHPYWGKQTAPLHYTSVRSEPKFPLRTFPSLLRGKPNQLGTPENGYRSENISALELRMDGLFTLDGELYEASSAAGPVMISYAGPIRFLHI